MPLSGRCFLRLPRVLVVIPARYGSTRFPGKPLAKIDGTEMILHVVRRAGKIRGVDKVVVATDDTRIMDIVTLDGSIAVMTSKAHKTGTSRVAEVASGARYGIIINIQGDEPILPVRGVEKLIAVMKAQRSIVMGTLAVKTDDPGAFANRDVVKVVTSRDGNALYFSRSCLPYQAGSFLRHTGIYAYRRSFLLRYGKLRRGPLEKTEGLEQLRALENGFDIRVVICGEKSLGVDTPEDIKRVEKRIRKR